MKIQHLDRKGYTIAEVMIFLAISSAVLVSTMLAFSGRQQRTEFNQAIREADSKIQDVANDFLAGFFTDADFNCTADDGGNRPVISVASNTQGTRKGCTFIGKVIQFAPSGVGEEGYRVITLVGRQFKTSILSEPVENIVQAKPKALDIGVEENVFGYGLTTKWVRVEGASPQDVGAILFFSSFADNDAVGSQQTTQLGALPGSSFNQTVSDVDNILEFIGNLPDPGDVIDSPYLNNPIEICMENGTNQHGIIRIGDNQRRLATTLSIESGACPA